MNGGRSCERVGSHTHYYMQYNEKVKDVQWQEKKTNNLNARVYGRTYIY